MRNGCTVRWVSCGRWTTTGASRRCYTRSVGKSWPRPGTADEKRTCNYGSERCPWSVTGPLLNSPVICPTSVETKQFENQSHCHFVLFASVHNHRSTPFTHYFPCRPSSCIDGGNRTPLAACHA